MTSALVPNPPIIKRADAHAKGLMRFFTGKPCSKGHVVQRYVASGTCVMCARSTGRSYARVKGGNLQRVPIPGKVHPDDLETVTQVIAMLNANREVRLAAREEASPIVSPFAAELARLPAGHQTPAFEHRPIPEAKPK